MNPAQKALREKASIVKAKSAAGFFKTGVGQYGEGDVFLGVTVPQIRQIAKAFKDLSESHLTELLLSPHHEDRLLALVILSNTYASLKDPRKKKRIVDFYLKYKHRINNWDLVDTSTYKILGAHCLEIADTAILKKLIRSMHHWDRRLAMVATLALIRKQQLDLTFEFAQHCFKDKEDLMHKATGWMLREAGKKNTAKLKSFLNEHGSKMPRTMLRYAIEKFTPEERAKILLKTKQKTEKKR